MSRTETEVPGFFEIFVYLTRLPCLSYSRDQPVSLSFYLVWITTTPMLQRLDSASPLKPRDFMLKMSAYSLILLVVPRLHTS